jgi:hypothetical protein
LNGEAERDGDRDDRDQVAAQAVWLAEGAEGAARIGRTGRKELGTEVLREPERGDR